MNKIGNPYLSNSNTLLTLPLQIHIMFTVFFKTHMTYNKGWGETSQGKQGRTSPSPRWKSDTGRCKGRQGWTIGTSPCWRNQVSSQTTKRRKLRNVTLGRLHWNDNLRHHQENKKTLQKRLQTTHRIFTRTAALLRHISTQKEEAAWIIYVVSNIQLLLSFTQRNARFSKVCHEKIPGTKQKLEQQMMTRTTKSMKNAKKWKHIETQAGIPGMSHKATWGPGELLPA